jgi:hypothetical protein
MATTVSPVQICSNALLELGAAPINSFEEDNDRTRLVANLWAQKRDMLLRSHPWNCAIKRVSLPAADDAPVFGWKHRFLLPQDWLRTLSVGEDGHEERFTVEGRYILTNSSRCLLRYIFRNEEPATWDALLIDGMAAIMKAALAYAITKSSTHQATEAELMARLLKQARTIDGQEVTQETLGDFPLLRHRMAV